MSEDYIRIKISNARGRQGLRGFQGIPGPMGDLTPASQATLNNAMTITAANKTAAEAAKVVAQANATAALTSKTTAVSAQTAATTQNNQARAQAIAAKDYRDQTAILLAQAQVLINNIPDTSNLSPASQLILNNAIAAVNAGAAATEASSQTAQQSASATNALKNQSQVAKTAAELAETNAETAQAASQAILTQIQAIYAAIQAGGSGTSTVAFTTAPSISTDGTPQVGEVVSLDFGVVSNGSIGTKLLVNVGTDATIATLISGSYQLTAAGTFRLKVFAQGSTSVFAYSPSITVAAATVIAMTAPVLSFPAARVAGANPPEVVLEATDDTHDLTTDSIVFEWDRQTTGAFVAVGSKTVALTIDMATAQELVFAEFGSFTAGSIRFESYFTRPNEAPSVRSNRLIDTLVAVVQPAATTVFDSANHSNQATLSNANRELAGNGGFGGRTAGAATTSRNDRRFAEFVITEPGTVSYDTRFCVGIAAVGYTFPQIVEPNSNVAFADYNGWDFAIGEAVTVDVTWKVGATQGQLKIYKKGVLDQTILHDLPAGVLMAGAFRDTRVKLNTGQEAFTFVPATATAANRWN